MDAYRELQETVARATELAATQPKYQKTAESAKRELEDLRLSLAFVTVIPGTEVILAGRKLSAADWGKPQPMMPGRTKVEIVAADGRTREKRLRLDPGETKVLTADFSSSSSRVTRAKHSDEVEAEEDREGSGEGAGSAVSRRTIGYVLGGVGIAGVLGFAGLNIYANSTFGTPTDDCSGSVCSKSDMKNAESKGTLVGLSYGMLGVGVVGLGLGTFLVLTDGSSPSSSTARIGIGPGSISFAKAF